MEGHRATREKKKDTEDRCPEARRGGQWKQRQREPRRETDGVQTGEGGQGSTLENGVSEAKTRETMDRERANEESKTRGGKIRRTRDKGLKIENGIEMKKKVITDREEAETGDSEYRRGRNGERILREWKKQRTKQRMARNRERRKRTDDRGHW